MVPALQTTLRLRRRLQVGRAPNSLGDSVNSLEKGRCTSTHPCPGRWGLFPGCQQSTKWRAQHCDYHGV
jgi:hypothetical protein